MFAAQSLDVARQRDVGTGHPSRVAPGDRDPHLVRPNVDLRVVAGRLDAPSVESPIRSTNSIAERKLSKMNVLAIIQDDMDAQCIIPTG